MISVSFIKYCLWISSGTTLGGGLNHLVLSTDSSHSLVWRKGDQSSSLMRSCHLLQNLQKILSLVRRGIIINEHSWLWQRQVCHRNPADGSMRCRCQMAIPLLGRGGDTSHPKIHIYTYVLNIYTHRCAKGTDEDGWGGPIAPINGLIMAATQDGTPCWEEIHPMKEFGKYGNTLPGNWNRVRSMEMKPPHRRCCPRWEKFRVRSIGFRAVFVCLCWIEWRCRYRISHRSSNRDGQSVRNTPRVEV